MKNILTIILASFILLSGMHLSIARHFCGGERTDVAFTFSGMNVGCGMEEEGSACGAHDATAASDCCRNEFSMMDVDDYLSSSSMQVKEITQPVFELFFLPLMQSLHSTDADLQLYADTSPPHFLAANAVSLPKICVFRIWCTGNPSFRLKGYLTF